jgi:predicted DNA-binding WGR domain protein/DNA polymerase III delta prime subunit
MSIQVQSFRQFLKTAFDNGDYATDDVIAFVLPLCKEVISFHEAGLVAPFENEHALFITENRLDIDERAAHKPMNAIGKVVALFERHKSRYFDSAGNAKGEIDLDDSAMSVENVRIHLNGNETLSFPAFIPGYRCFEMNLGHHDELTDIFCLGCVLGSMALGLNLNEEKDLALFAKYRSNPILYNHRIHPTISSLIAEMTELSRQKRLQDLYDVVNRLQHYRDYDPEKQTDLSNIAGWINKSLTNRNQLILNKLRNRLFDTSRRNRLLYYKPNMRFVNLTVSSVPMVLHYQSIRPELLFTWNKDISDRVIGMKEIVLNKYLRFEDHLYLPSSLDKIRIEAQRDIQEYGFSQLKLVIVYLNWHNLKEDPEERIQSPLLLVPAELKKNKKLKEDHFILKITDNVAEVNPVLASYLKELYGIELPDFVDLDEMTPEQFYQLLKSQIDAANQGIVLNYIQKPRIRLVHNVAKQTVTNFKKRLQRSGKQLSSYKDVGYSYQQEQYKPLGLEIFRQRVEPKTGFLESLGQEEARIVPSQLTESVADKQQRPLFELSESEGNPYSWDFDMCNIVLGNFNYKKMSLVRDYNFVIDNQVPNEVFEQLFSSKPKPTNVTTQDWDSTKDWYHVITADPTQTRAILKSRDKESYIIQGPPGTGKSQTITNLIADFAARGHSILFVCEKRAALDVVYHRLKQQGLDELCCYIHDSLGDKKEFIRNLKQTYEDFTNNKMDLERIQLSREALLKQTNEQLELLKQFHTTHTGVPEQAGIEFRKLLERVVELKEHLVTRSVRETDALPHYKEWLEFGNVIQQLSNALEETGAEPTFAEHPFSKINENIFSNENPHIVLENLLTHSRNLLTDITTVVRENNIPTEHTNRLEQIKNLVQVAIVLNPLAETDSLSLVDEGNESARKFDKGVHLYKQQQQHYEQIRARNKNWKTRLSEQDMLAAIPLAAKHEESFLNFLNSKWNRLKNKIDECYDFSQHAVHPGYVTVLQQLKEEYDAANMVAMERHFLQQQYKVDNVDLTHLSIERIRARKGDKEIDYLLHHAEANQLVMRLGKLNQNMQKLQSQLQQCLNEYDNKPISDIYDELESISMNAESLRDLLPALREYSELPESVKDVLRKVSVTPLQAEAGMANKTLSHIYQNNKVFANTDMHGIEKAVRQIQHCYKQLLKVNADYIRAVVRQRFLHNVELSNIASSQLSPEQREFKKNYTEGRKILENEFNKSIRFKSIRELSAKESGLVLKDLKSVWLMSPLSVSDSLPVDIGFFDVVIFDEASQITLEEGIPALYRAKQTIIVGDDKQMPPTNFFAVRTEDPDDLEVYSDEDDEGLLSNDADSLLVQGARKLNNVMLGWHYRSRFETLISFSNHAFYEANLLTIPDKIIHHTEKKSIEITRPQEAANHADALFDRSISFHFLPTSVYEKRINTDEADYIAYLVKTLLQRKIKESIGIVAFSQEQQEAIENALTNLASKDKAFEQVLEDAWSRTEEDQFTGLFVKNLENVQGDERDIIIMSVCYGFDSRKKMIMNFGPINKKGGEKRLNVIFSRAKKHMAVVSSIRHHHITNEYNEGANYFKRFLQYSELVSCGDMKSARTILDSLVLHKKERLKTKADSIILQQIREQLEKKGYEVAEQVGQSDFKCSLAVKAKSADTTYSLSILLDDDRHYRNENLLEQYYQRPAILQTFNWRTINVFAKDWLSQPDKVLEQIIKRLHQEPGLEEDKAAETANIANEAATTNEHAEPPIAGIPAITPETPAAATPYDHLTFHRLINAEGDTSRFWEAALDGCKLIVRYGRVGTKGQVHVKTFAKETTAQLEKDKMIKEKANKGYKPTWL